MKGLLHDRRATLQVDTVKIECLPGGIDISFSVEKDLKAKPNTASFRVWNLNPDRRKALVEKAAKKAADGKPRGVRVRLEAGYKDQVCQIFDGDVRFAWCELDGPDAVLRLESGDGERAVVNARINRSWAPGTSVETVLKDLGDVLGLGPGNLAEKARGAVLTGFGSTFTGGTVASGSVVKELTRITRSAGLEWSIQDGTLQLLGTGKSLDGTAVLVSPGTGMLDSPSIDQKGIVTVKMLMIPDVFPGRKLKIEAEGIQGFFRVEKAKYSGDTAGQDWYIDCECKRL